VAEQVQEAVTVLPETIPESLPPAGIGIEALYVLVVELVQPLPGGYAPGDENEIQAIHQPPVFLESSFHSDRRPEGGAGKGGEFGHVHVIQSQVDDKIRRPADRFLRFTWKPHHEKPFGP